MRSFRILQVVKAFVLRSLAQTLRKSRNVIQPNQNPSDLNP